MVSVRKRTNARRIEADRAATCKGKSTVTGELPARSISPNFREGQIFLVHQPCLDFILSIEQQWPANRAAGKSSLSQRDYYPVAIN